MYLYTGSMYRQKAVDSQVLSPSVACRPRVKTTNTPV